MGKVKCTHCLYNDTLMKSVYACMASIYRGLNVKMNVFL
jgi:hypothetical protein